MPPRRRRRSTCLRAAAAAALLALLPADALLGQEDAAGDSVPSSPAPGPEADGSGRRFLPFPVLFYAPETGLGFGAGAVWYFRREGSRLSSLSPIAVYTTKSQFLVSARLDSWWARDLWLLSADAGFSRFPTKTWGTGNDSPDEAEEDYTPRTLRGLVRVEHRVVGRLYLGGTASALTRSLVEVEDGGSLATGEAPGTGTTDLVSAGLAGSIDTRDDVVYPRRGLLGRLSLDAYDDALGSDFSFRSWSVDLRGYLPLGRHVLAGQALVSGVSGSVPFDRLPQLGGDRLLRGYYEGRYRDRGLLLLQAEARIALKGRFGAVAHLGAGQVLSRAGDLSLGAFHPSIGAGLRYQLARDRPLNARADVAFGEDSFGFYVQVGEAF